MTIGKRIVLGFGTLVALLAGVGGFATLKFNTTDKSVQVIQDAVPSLALAHEMLTRTLENYALVQEHILTTDDAAIAAVETRMKANSEANAKGGKEYEAAIRSDAERALFADYNAKRTALIEARKEVLAASSANENVKATTLLRTKLDPLMVAYRNAIDDLVKYNTDATNASVAEVEAAANSGKLGAVVSVIASLAIASVCAILIIRSVSKALTRIAGVLSTNSSQVASASTQVSASSQSLAQGASEQAASLEESSSAIEEMASMIKKNADTSQQANVLSDDARRAADAGSEAMNRMSTAIADIERSSQETAKIIKTIDEIAFQTNLLALNAAVEAARAGEAGKGFAVVAEEVRNLAMRSAEAAKNTSSLIEESVGKAKNGVSIAQTVAENLTQINEATVKVTGLIAEIAASSKEQATGIDQITQAVGQMDKVTQTNAANAEETAAASEELSAQAEQLQSCVRDLQVLVGIVSTALRPEPARTGAVGVAAASRHTRVMAAASPSPAERIPLESAPSTGDFSAFSKAA